jgi:hypothetical protein
MFVTSMCNVSQWDTAETIDIVSQLHSLNKARFREIRMPQPAKKPLDQVRDAIRLKHYAYSTEKTYL